MDIWSCVTPFLVIGVDCSASLGWSLYMIHEDLFEVLQTKLVMIYLNYHKQNSWRAIWAIEHETEGDICQCYYRWIQVTTAGVLVKKCRQNFSSHPIKGSAVDFDAEVKECLSGAETVKRNSVWLHHMIISNVCPWLDQGIELKCAWGLTEFF